MRHIFSLLLLAALCMLSQTAFAAYMVQAGAFSSAENAARLARTFQSQSYDAGVVHQTRDGKDWFRVYIGLFDEKPAAMKLAGAYRHSSGKKAYVSEIPGTVASIKALAGGESTAPKIPSAVVEDAPYQSRSARPAVPPQRKKVAVSTPIPHAGSQIAYVVQVGAFADYNAARDLAEQLAERYNVRLMDVYDAGSDNMRWHVVHLGLYGDRNDAVEQARMYRKSAKRFAVVLTVKDGVFME